MTKTELEFRYAYYGHEHQKAKIMTWAEFKETCKADAESWIKAGWKSEELTPEDIINEYPKDYFCDDVFDETDEESFPFTAEEFAYKTLGYMMNEEMKK